MRTRVVTPEQLATGYSSVAGGLGSVIPTIATHKFFIIRQLPDGNYLVQHPDMPMQKEAKSNG